MSVTPSPIGGFAAQFFDNNGVILSGGKIYTYAAGTTTPQASYTSAAGVTPHANPIILDSAGRVPGGEIWLTDGLIYKFVIETALSVLIGTYDNITGVNSNFVNYTVQEEVITATAGQTVFNLSTINYTPGTNSLSVYIDGVNQYVGDSYLETDSDTVTFTSGVHVGGEVKFTTAIQTTTGAIDSNYVGFLQAGTGAVARTAQAKMRDILDAADFGITMDGTDKTTAFASLCTAASSTGKSIQLGVGTLLIRQSGAAQALPAGVHIFGQGREATIIKVQNSGSGAYGLTLGIGCGLHNLTMQADDNGSNFAATHSFNAATSDLVFENVRFLGTTTVTGNQGARFVNGSGANVSRVQYLNCHFELLEQGIFKDNADTSVQYDFLFDGCTFRNCTDALNINSPVGAWSRGVISNCSFDNITQFPIALAGAGCTRWVMKNCNFTDCTLEGIHLEALTNQWIIDGCTFALCNKTAGVSNGSGGIVAGVNGAIHAITSTHSGSIVNCIFDLTQNTTGAPNGIALIAQGVSDPYDISVTNCRFYAKSGCIPLYAPNFGIDAVGELDISDNHFENQSASKAAYMIDASFARISGSGNRFVNPTALIKVDDNTGGTLYNSSFFGDLSTLAYLTGNTVGTTGTTIAFIGVRARVLHTAAIATPSWQDVLPAGVMLNSDFAARWIQNGTAAAWAENGTMAFKTGGTLTVVVQNFLEAAGITAPTATDWQVSGGKIQARTTAYATLAGQLFIDITGRVFG